MKRQILLIEPNYSNKYPPMGLMKLSTYYKKCGDHVRFFKGDLLDLAAEILLDDLFSILMGIKPDVFWKMHYKVIFEYVRKGKEKNLKELLDDIDCENVFDTIRDFRCRFQKRDYFNNPKFDKVGITTLFTFHWKITIDTIKFASKFCKQKEDVMVGGIMSSLLPDEVYHETGIRPYVGQLSKPHIIDDDNDLIIDELPLDYSILDEIDYKYPAQDAYFAYMTRGCCNKCSFCAVPKLEPEFKNYIQLKSRITETTERFGEQRNLLLLDNNVFASNCFEQIIDEIKYCGFQKGATYLPPNKYQIAIKNLREGYNDRAYIRQCISLYKWMIEKLGERGKDIYQLISDANCTDVHTATKDNILRLDEVVSPIFNELHKPSRRKRIVDFNQGVDARLINDKNMSKLAEINIEPLRIAFDHWELRETYEKAIRTAARHGICNLSNYLLYNFNDKPEDLYNRMRLNVDLCEELKVSIYSFPMKYHPIEDPLFFKNRTYLGQHWNRKFIRAIQAVLNSTKGKIGRGLSFFNRAFGSNLDGFFKILWMPEAFIIYRDKNDKNGMTEKWWNDFSSLPPTKKQTLERIVEKNDFSNIDALTDDEEILKVLKYYTISRNDIENG